MNSPENFVSASASNAGPAGDSSASDASLDSTLRLIARLTPPAGLEDRIHAGLQAELQASRFRVASPKGRVLVWPASQPAAVSWFHSRPARTAAAMAIVAVVLGGGWGIASRVKPTTTAGGPALPNRAAGPGGFSSAGAMRTPQTLHGPVVVPGLVQSPAGAISPVKSKTLKKPLLPGATDEQRNAEAKPASGLNK